MPIPAPPLTLPILRAILNRAQVSIDSLVISAPTKTGFSLAFTVTLTKCGPFPALVTFPAGLELWDSNTGRRVAYADPDVPLDLASVPASSTFSSTPKASSSADGGVAGSLEIRGGGCQDGTLVAGVHLDPDNGTAWLEHVLLADSTAGVPVQFHAKARVTALGFRWKGVDVIKDVRFGGLAGLGGALRPSSPRSRSPSRKKRSSIRATPTTNGKHDVRIDSLEILPATSEASGVICSASIGLSNPSREISLSLDGPLSLDLFTATRSASKLGTATIPMLRIPGGQTASLRTDIRLDPNAAGADGSDFLTHFLGPPSYGGDLHLVARGTNSGRDAAWLPRLLNRVELVASLPPLPNPVLKDVAIAFARGADTPPKVCVALRNPFAAPLHLRSLVATFRLSGADQSDPPLGTLKGAMDENGSLDIPLRQKNVTITAVEDTIVDLDMHPHSLVRILRSAAAVRGTDLSGIEGVLRLVEGRPLDKDTVAREMAPRPKAKKQRSKAGPPLDLVHVVSDALRGLRIDVDARVSLVIGGSHPARPKASPALPHHVQPHATAIPGPAAGSEEAKKGYSLEGLKLVQASVPAEIGADDVATVVEKVAEPVATGLLDSAVVSLTRIRLLPRAGSVQPNGRMMNGSAHVEVEEDDGTEVEVEIEVGGLEALGALQAVVTFEGGLELEWEGRKAGRMIFSDPLVVSGHAESHNSMKGMLLVQDQNRFSKLVRQLVTTASIDVRATCPRLTLVVAGVRIAPRPFSKPIHVRGLDSLRSLRLESFDLPRECAPKKDGGIGIKVEGKGIVDGPATLELDFDEIAVDLLHSDSDVGAATIRGLQLRKGEPARFTVDGRLDATSSTRSARALSALMSQALADETGGVLTAQIRSFKLPSDARLPWLSEALERVPIAIPVTLPSSAAKELVQGMELGTTQLTFRGDNHFPAFTCDEVLIKVLSPFGFPLRVLRAWGALGLRWKGRLGGKIDLPELAVSGVDGKEPITGSDRRTTAKIGFSDAPLLDPSAEVLEDFARAVAASEEEMLGMDGSGLSIVVGTAAGDLTLSGIPLETEAKVQGLNGYRGGAAQLSDVRVAKGENDHLKVTMMAWFNSPGQLVIHAEKVTERMSLPVYFTPDTSTNDPDRGVLIGRANLAPTFSIWPGPTHIPIVFEYAPLPEQSKQAGILLSDFLSGRTSTLRIRGDDESAAPRVLREALKSIHLDAILKPMADKTLLQSVSVSLGIHVAVKNIDSTFIIANPFELPMRLKKVVATVTHRGQPFGSLAPIFKDFVVPPASGLKIPTLATSPSFVVKLRQPLDKLVGSWGSARGSLLLDIELEADVEIGAYAIKGFKYKQQRLPLKIQGLEGVSRFLKYIPL